MRPDELMQKDGMIQGRGPVVSVIMIFLNEERFIRDAIESVRAQTYPAWELLLVDDGSTDGSTAIAREYAERYPQQVRYLEHDAHQNRGMSASRNLGLSTALGQYIAFLDGDDVYLPQKLERQVPLLEQHPTAVMVYGATQRWYSWSGRAEDAARDAFRRLGVPPNTLVQPPELVLRFLAGSAETPGICGVLARRAVLLEVGGFEEDFRDMFEDQVCFYKICLRYPVFVESGSWDRYRQHGGATSVRARRSGYHWRRANPRHRAFMTWLERYVAEKGIKDPRVRRLVRRRAWPYRHPVLYGLAVLGYNARAVVRRTRKALGMGARRVRTPRREDE